MSKEIMMKPLQMKRCMPRAILVLSLLVGMQFSVAANMQLYETGPAEDASFIRFVNGGEGNLDVTAKGSQTRIHLGEKQPVSDFMPVRAGTKMQGTLKSGGKAKNVDILVKPGEFVSVIGIPGKESVQSVLMREQPDDFNALKASVGFYNLEPACVDAGLLAAVRNVAMFEHVANGAVARRQVNAVPLSVKASCAGKPVGDVLDLGTLQAGERHTVFLLPSAKGPRLLHALDKTTR